MDEVQSKVLNKWLQFRSCCVARFNQKILKKINAVSFFIDDMPLNIDSVSKECPETHCIHFLQDERINKLMPSPKSATIKLNNWLDVENYIMKNLIKIFTKFKTSLRL